MAKARVYKSFLHRIAALANSFGRPWRKLATDASFSRRQYKSYDDYVRHQASKLEKLDLTAYDERFAKALGERLKSLNFAWPGKSVLCLAARTGAECKAFTTLGSFAVGIDLNPGPANRYVVHGDFHNLQFADHSVDVVYTNALDHALDLEKLLKEIHRVLKHTGIFIAEVVHGSNEPGGRKPGTHESLWWDKSEDVIKVIAANGFGVERAEEITNPFEGVRAVSRPQTGASAGASTPGIPLLVPLQQATSSSSASVRYEVDEFFHRVYEAGIARSGTPDTSPTRRMRFFSLMQALQATSHLPGWIAECGCWRGLSAFLICEYQRKSHSHYAGSEMVVIDSFEGLSAPGDQDIVEHDVVVQGRPRRGRPFKSAGAYAASMEHVRNVLEGYPKVEIVQGWIPSALSSLPERSYCFVHIDLDLYEPILGALRYFFPRLVPGGVIACDDYGSLFFPGAQKAVDAFSREVQVGVFQNAAGEAFLIKT